MRQGDEDGRNKGKNVNHRRPRHQSCVQYPWANILIIIMCGVLFGLDALGDLVIYAKNKEGFLVKEAGIEKVPSKSGICEDIEPDRRPRDWESHHRCASKPVWNSRGGSGCRSINANSNLTGDQVAP